MNSSSCWNSGDEKNSAALRACFLFFCHLISCPHYLWFQKGIEWLPHPLLNQKCSVAWCDLLNTQRDKQHISRVGKIENFQFFMQTHQIRSILRSLSFKKAKSYYLSLMRLCPQMAKPPLEAIAWSNWISKNSCKIFWCLNIYCTTFWLRPTVPSHLCVTSFINDS